MKNLILSLLLSSFVIAASANEGTQPVNLATVKFKGTIDSKPIFEVQFAADSANYLVAISDELGTTIYKDVVKANTKRKTFVLDDEGTQPIETFLFRITNKATNETVEFLASQNEVLKESYSRFSIAKK